LKEDLENMSNVTIEELREEQLQDILQIYNYYIENTTATFHAHEMSSDEMRELVFFNADKYQSFVLKENETILGYVSLKQYSKREAYDNTAEVTIYLRHDCIGKGVGSMAVRFIEEFAREKGIHALLAGICGENTDSIRLFERSGYVKCAHYREVGRKFGRILDVVAYEKLI
jgi:phosphinothricin acetyltransferase